MHRDPSPSEVQPAKGPALDRRRLFGGAATVGALAAAAAMLPRTEPSTPAAEATAPQADDATGYRLTAHIQRYYQTARV